MKNLDLDTLLLNEFSVILCRRGAKQPANTGWLDDAQPISAYPFGMKWEDYNLGVVCGKHSGVVVLDVDARNGGLDSIKDFGCPLTLKTLCSNGGYHLYYRLPQHLRTASFPKILAPGVDIQCQGRFVIAPPSVHPSGHRYTWADPQQAVADAPSWLLDLITKLPTKAERKELAQQARHTIDLPTLVSMLADISVDTYPDWIRVATALKFELPDELGFELFADWSSKQAKYESREDCLKYWDSIHPSGQVTGGTLRHLAKVGAEEQEEEAQQRAEAVKLEKYPKEMPLPPEGGLLNIAMDVVLESASKPNRDVALFCAIHLINSVINRRMVIANSSVTMNLYTLLLLDSSGGKQIGEDVLLKVLELAGLKFLALKTDLRSDVGMLNDLAEYPKQTWINSEAGSLLQTILSPKAGVFGARLTGLIKEISDSSEIRMAGTANRKARSVVHPGVNLCLVSAPRFVTQSLSETTILDGFIGRFLTVLSKPTDFVDQPLYPVIADNPKAHILAKALFELNNGLLAHLEHGAGRSMLEGSALVSSLSPWEAAKAIETTEGVCDHRKSIRNDFKQSEYRLDPKTELPILGSDVTKAYWGKHPLQVTRLAAISAVSRNWMNPEISQQDIDWAKAVVMFCGMSMYAFVETFQGNDGPEQLLRTKILDFVRDNPRCSRTALIKSCNPKNKRALDEAIDVLAESGRLKAITIRGRTKPSTVFMTLEHLGISFPKT